MKEISLNLIPPRLLREQAERRRRRGLALAVAAAAIVIALAYAALDLRIAVVGARAAQLNREAAPLRPLVATVNRLDADRAALRRREATLARLTILRPRWSAILSDLGALVPRDVWFTSLSVDNGRISIQGRSDSAAAVSILSARLETARFLDASSLRFIRAEPTSGGTLLTFEISGALRGAAAPP